MGIWEHPTSDISNISFSQGHLVGHFKPQNHLGWKEKNTWNHHLDGHFDFMLLFLRFCPSSHLPLQKKTLTLFSQPSKSTAFNTITTWEGSHQSWFIMAPKTIHHLNWEFHVAPSNPFTNGGVLSQGLPTKKRKGIGSVSKGLPQRKCSEAANEKTAGRCVDSVEIRVPATCGPNRFCERGRKPSIWCVKTLFFGGGRMKSPLVIYNIKPLYISTTVWVIVQIEDLLSNDSLFWKGLSLLGVWSIRLGRLGSMTTDHRIPVPETCFKQQQQLDKWALSSILHDNKGTFIRNEQIIAWLFWAQGYTQNIWIPR